jgi:peptidase E
MWSDYTVEFDTSKELCAPFTQEGLTKINVIFIPTTIGHTPRVQYIQNTQAII